MNYQQLDIFSELKGQMGTPLRVLAYRKQMLVWGGLFFTWMALGVHVEAMQAGLFRGSLTRPELVPAILGLTFLFNFLMYEIQLQKHIDIFHFRSFLFKSTESYTFAIAKLSLGEKLNSIKSVRNTASFFEPRDVVQTSFRRVHGCIIEASVSSELTSHHTEELEKIPNLKVLDKGRLEYEYNLTNRDRGYLEKNRRFFKQLAKHEFMDAVFPRIFGVSVLVLICCWSYANSGL